jgi:hypothetical protein
MPKGIQTLHKKKATPFHSATSSICLLGRASRMRLTRSCRTTADLGIICSLAIRSMISATSLGTVVCIGFALIAPHDFSREIQRVN